MSQMTQQKHSDNNLIMNNFWPKELKFTKIN